MNKMMLKCLKVRFLSDIHTELQPNKVREFLDKIKPSVAEESVIEVCVLAGDIGDPYSPVFTEFMTEINVKFAKSFFVPGNHEYYRNGKTVVETNAHMENLFSAKFPNIVFLNNRVYKDEILGYSFIGSTLWSRIVNPQFQINDTHAISGLTVDSYNQLHTEALDFLERALSLQDAENKCIVITHHMPLYELVNPCFLTHRLARYNQWFASDLSGLMSRHHTSVTAWIYGHTHIRDDREARGIRFVCNPFGYEYENDISDEDYLRHITVRRDAV